MSLSQQESEQLTVGAGESLADVKPDKRDEWDDVPIQVIPKGTVLHYNGPIGFKLLEDVTARGCWSIAEHDERQAGFTRRRQAMEAKFLAGVKASHEDAVSRTVPIEGCAKLPDRTSQ